MFWDASEDDNVLGRINCLPWLEGILPCEIIYDFVMRIATRVCYLVQSTHTKTANIKQRFWSKETWETWDPFCPNSRQNIDPEDLISAVMFFAICSITVIWKSWVLRPLVTCQYIIKRPLGEIESQRACYFNTNLSVVNFFLHGSLLKQRHYHYQWRELTSLRGRFRRGRVRGDSSSPPLFGACHAG